MFYFCFKWGSKDLNNAGTGDLKKGGRGMKSGFDRRTHLYHLFR